MKVIGSTSRSQEHKSTKLPIRQCKTLIGNNSGSIEDGATVYDCETEKCGMVIRMASELLSRIYGFDFLLPLDHFL